MRKRTLLAAAVSPLVSIPIVVIWFAIFYLFLRGSEDIVDSWVWLLIILGYVLPIAYIATFLIGIPVDWLLRRFRLRSPATYALIGVVLGGAIGVNMFEPFHLIAVTALCGLAISVSFRVISNNRDEHVV